MEMLNMNKELFDKSVKESEVPVLVEFWAPWCTYCRRIAPAMTKVISENQGNILIGQVNIDDEEELAELEKIEIIPTFVMYKNGKAIASIVAPESKAKIDEFITESLAK